MITIEELTTQRILFLVHGDTETQRCIFSLKRNKKTKNSVSPCLCVQINKHLNDNDRRINYTEDFVLVHGDTETQRNIF